MRVLICGSRNWKAVGKIKDFINFLPQNAIIIEGGAAGVDSMAAHFARKRGITVKEFPADWEKHGKSAGFKRNYQMLKAGHPDVVYAFVQDENNSSGTLHMISIAEKEGIEVRKHYAKDNDEATV